MKRPLNATMCNVPMNFKFFATETVEMILHLMKDLLRLMEHLMVMLALLQQPTKAQVNQCQLILNYNQNKFDNICRNRIEEKLTLGNTLDKLVGVLELWLPCINSQVQICPALITDIDSSKAGKEAKVFDK